MGKNIVLFGRGCFIEFVNIDTSEEKHLMCNCHRINGDGVKCLRGHSTLYIFAYAENCQGACIYVKSFPDFQVIAKFVGGPKEGYKCLAFSETSLLFSLGEMPRYTVSVWNWRSLEKFAESDNELLFEDQIIRCSYGRPMYLAQVGVKSNKLFIWDVFTVCKTSVFSKHEVHVGELEPAPFEDLVWTHDGAGSLYIIDSRGSIYTVDRDFYLEKVISFSAEGSITPSICWYNQGITVSGPVQEVRHYKRTGQEWLCDWSYPTNRKLHCAIGGKLDHFVALTENSEIVCLGSTPESQKYVREANSDFKDICLINPAGEFLVAWCRRGLLVYNLLTGELITSFKFEALICSMAENPHFPYLAFGLETGELCLISFYNEAKPSILLTMALGDHPLDTTKFFEQGHIFVTGNWNRGEFFILRGLPGTQIEVIVHLELNRQFADYMLVASQNIIKFFAIPVISNVFYAGYTILRYCIVNDQVVNVREYVIAKDLCGSLYRKIMPTTGPDRDKNFYIIPFNTKSFQLIEIRRGSEIMTIKEVFKTGHQLNRFYLLQTKYYTITWCYDGFIYVRSLDLQKQIGMSLSHHRYLQGVRTARINPTGTIIVSLGNDGVLAAVLLSKNVEDKDIKQHIINANASTRMILMFKRPTLGFYVEERFAGKCWKEIKRLKNTEVEEDACKVEKNNILAEFRDIQAILQELVTRNFHVPENKKLDLLEFYLDIPLYNKKQVENREECRRLETYLRSLIVAQDKVSTFIIKNYWEPMGVQWEQILGIFSAVKATNYCLLPENQAKLYRLKWIEQQRQVEQFLTCKDSFEPWIWVSKKKLYETLARRPVLPTEDYSGVTNRRWMREIEEAEANKSLDTRIALAGAVSQTLIEISTGHYQQRQITSFYQCELQQAIAEREVIKLKVNYNQAFQAMRAVKEREVYNVKERNARLRHIISEYNYFSGRKVHAEIVDPEWAETENPEQSILRTTDDEISITPYISPSQQAILDAKAIEEERLRQLMLADDFRERALMAMMNGVLEVKWEDELKKDVPLPKCRLEKQPEEFGEEDLIAIRNYEEKVAQLNFEREKYRSLLDVEFNKVSTAQRDSIRRFNQKLYECTKYKFYIDQSMNQENLQVNRHRVNQKQRIELDQKERETIESIKLYEKDVEYNAKLVTFMQGALVECRINLEAMQLKEKALDKAYRKDFIDTSPVVQEQASKYYKKRPKVSFRNITTATVLNELAKCIITNETTIGMTQECLDYMKALEHLDMYTDVRPTVDEDTWALICKHRRIRIDYEIRLRAGQIQILDGEATIATFQKRVSTKKEKIGMLNAELADLRAQRLHLMHNKQVQIVLRRGLVEILLTGDLLIDFDDAILVPKSEIEHVNNLIIEAGELKLKTILENLQFRRKIMGAEWEHTRLRMQINDLIEQKKDIENVKFTKEMQAYLKNKNLGRKPEGECFEMDIEVLSAAYRKRIKDRKDKYKRMKKQLEIYKANNKLLDKTIQKVNIDVCHYKLQKDWDVEVQEKEILQHRMCALLKRNGLVQKIQKNHNEILVLQTELELLRLRTFPAFKYKVLDE